MLEKIILAPEANGMGTRSILVILFMMLVLKIVSASGYIPIIFFISAYRTKSVLSVMKNVNII